jgi:hypothetical protein
MCVAGAYTAVAGIPICGLRDGGAAALQPQLKLPPTKWFKCSNTIPGRPGHDFLVYGDFNKQLAVCVRPKCVKVEFETFGWSQRKAN